MQLPKTICMLPWMSMEVTPMGTYRPCCVYKETIPGYSVQEGHTVADAQHSQYMQDLRLAFLRGEKPKGCSQCWDEEKALGRSSKRRTSFVKFKDVQPLYDESGVEPIFLDLKLGNLCNLKCRICGSWSSSKWAQEEIDIANGENQQALQQLKQGQWPRTSPNWWDSLESALPYVEFLEFTGGEPFLIKEHFQLLQKLVDNGYAGNIDVHYNTNGTTFPEEGPEIWRQFKRVEIAFSIDDIGPRFEYQRYGSKWSEVDENVRRFVALPYSNIALQICTTFNIQNLYYWPSTKEWIESVGISDLYFNLLHEPYEFCLRNLPEHAKHAIAAQLKENTDIRSIIEFMLLPGKDASQDLKAKLEKNDRYRRQDFATVHPEVSNLIWPNQ